MPQFESVEEVEFEETKIKEVDELFDSAKEPVNNLVDTSNGLTEAVRSLKQVVMAEAEGDAIKPLGVAKLTMTDAGLGLALTCPMGNPIKPPKQAAASFKKVNKKIGLVAKRLTKLKAQDDAWAVELVKDGETAMLKRGTGVEKDIKDMDRSFTKLTTRLIDLQDDLLPQVELKTVFSEGVSQLQKGNILPKLDVNFDDVSQPKLDVSWDESKADKDSEKQPILKKIKDAFQALIDCIKKIFSCLPDLVTQIKELISKAVEFPEKGKDMAASAGLGGLEVVKAVKNLASNVSAIKNVPGIANGVLNNSKNVVGQLQESLGGEAMPMEGEMAKPMEGEMEKPMEGEMEKPMEGEMEKPMEGEMEKPMEGEMEKPMEGEMEKPMEKPMEGETPAADPGMAAEAPAAEPAK